MAYIDHNTLQSGFENADDHRYIQSVAKKHGIWFSRPGQRHLPSGASGALRQARQDPDRLRQPHAHRRRHRHAGHGCGRSGRGGRHGRRRVLHHHAEDVQGQSDRPACGRSSPPRTSAWRCCGILSVKGGVGTIIEWGGEGIDRRCPFRSAPPSPTWARSWARPRPSSPRTRSPGLSSKAEGREADYTPPGQRPGRRL